MCGEGMDVWALGVQSRGVHSTIAPNGGDHLDCEQCGMCIDVCPVGALTSGSYRYKTRPWEMNHVATVCTHCADGCKVTLGVRQTNDGSEIVRADNRDKSGINGDFLCAKGRFGFDFVESAERLTKPLVRNAEGKLEPATWEHALRLAAGNLQRDARQRAAARRSASLARTRAPTKRIIFCKSLRGRCSKPTTSTTSGLRIMRPLRGLSPDTRTRPPVCAIRRRRLPILLIGGNPTEEHPLLAWNLRTNVRLNRGRLYIANTKAVKLERQAKATLRLPADGYAALAAYLDGGKAAFDRPAFREAVLAEESLLVVFGAEFSGAKLASLVAWGLKRGNVRFAFLGDYANSRGAADMGLLPDLLPGYLPVAAPGAFAAEYPGLPATPGKTLSGNLRCGGQEGVGRIAGGGR